MENKLAVQSQGTFLDTAIMDLSQMQVAAKMILDSKLAPDHFYEKGADNKPDYTKGKVESVILVCVHGHDLGLDVHQLVEFRLLRIIQIANHVDVRIIS